MALTPADIEQFGGLQLSSDPAEVGLTAALIAANVEIALDRSYVRSRDGLVLIDGGGQLSGDVSYSMIPDATATSGARRLLVVSESATRVYLDEVYTVYTALGDWAATPTKFHDLLNYGTPTATITFIAGSGATLRKWTGGALNASGIGKPKYLGVSPTSNRLVQAHFANAADSPTGANGSVSTVFFSGAGLPESFGLNDYVHLRPGDGEEIRGVATWRGQTFVFKGTTMFIFAGEGTDATGQPVFDYRAVNLGSRIKPPSATLYGRVVLAADDGVYYLADDGLYLTTGGPPVCVSRPLDALLRDGSSLVANGIGGSGQRVVIQSSSGADYALDARNGQWVTWLSAVGDSTAAPIEWPQFTASPPGALFHAIGHKVLFSHPSATADGSTTLPTTGGSAIATNYTSGFGDLGSTAIKTVRQTDIWGTGSPTFAVAKNYAAPDTGQTIALGASTSRGIDRTARRGSTLAFKLSAASGAWRVESLTMLLRPLRVAGVKA